MADKYEVRKYIEDKLGIEYLIPVLGVWNSVEEIDFSKEYISRYISWALAKTPFKIRQFDKE